VSREGGGRYLKERVYVPIKTQGKEIDRGFLVGAGMGRRKGLLKGSQTADLGVRENKK